MGEGIDTRATDPAAPASDWTSVLGAEPGVFQVGILVADLEAAARAYGALLGVRSWSVYTYDSGLLGEMSYAGRPAEFAMRIALSPDRPVVELIEPLAGPNVYEDWRRSNPLGLHHVGVLVDSLDDGIARAAAAGFSVLQCGRGYGLDGDGGFAYLDTEESLGIVIELLEVPRRRRRPEAIWELGPQGRWSEKTDGGKHR